MSIGFLWLVRRACSKLIPLRKAGKEGGLGNRSPPVGNASSGASTDAPTSSIPGTQQPPPPTIYSTILDFSLLLILVIVTIYVFVLLRYSVHTQIDTYLKASDLASKLPDHGPDLVFAFTRGMDAAIVKSTVIFMGFIITIIGAMYVLRTATASFKLDGGSGEIKGSLETSSPGLVMVVLGIVAVGLALFSKTDVDITSSEPVIQVVTPPPPSGAPAGTVPPHTGKPGQAAQQQPSPSGTANASGPGKAASEPTPVIVYPTTPGAAANPQVSTVSGSNQFGVKTYSVHTKAQTLDNHDVEVQRLLDGLKGAIANR